MKDQYADSDTRVNRDASSESELTSKPASTLGFMVAKREESPEPITEYVRHRLRQWLDPDDGSVKRTQKELVALGGFAGASGKSSMIAQVYGGTSNVTNITGPKFAKALGFADYPELVSAAYAWARDKSILPAEGGALAEGIRIALGYRVTQDQIDRVVMANEHRRDHLDGLDWLGLFLAERQLDDRIGSELLAAGRMAESRKPKLTPTQKAEAKAERQRAEHREVKEVAEIKARHRDNKARNRAVRRRKSKSHETG